MQFDHCYIAIRNICCLNKQNQSQFKSLTIILFSTFRNISRQDVSMFLQASNDLPTLKLVAFTIRCARCLDREAIPRGCFPYGSIALPSTVLRHYPTAARLRFESYVLSKTYRIHSEICKLQFYLKT